MLVTFLIFAVVLLAFLAGLIFYLKPAANKPVSTVPGMEPSDEKQGNIPDISACGSFHAFLVDLHSNFGPVASFWYGTQFCISVANAALFKDIQQLFDRPALLFEFLAPVTTHKAIQFVNGSEGRRKHMLYSRPFAHQSCVNVLPAFNKFCAELAKNWSTLPSDEHIPLHEYMMALAIKLITGTQFGTYFKKDKTTLEFHTLYERLMTNMDSILIGEFSESDVERYAAFKRTLLEFKGMVKHLIRTHKTARISGDYEKAPFLDCLLDETGDDEEEAMADAITFVIGGFHTTGNLLTWFFYYLSIYPEVQDRVAKEIETVMSTRKELDEEGIKKLTYTTQVLEETLRCSITAPFAARTHEESYEVRIGGHVIPPEVPVVVALGVALHDEKYFPEPGKFDPDRFSAANISKRPSLAFSPFGIASRKCPGYKFSYFEAYAAVVALVPKFKLKPAFDSDYYVEPKFGFVTKPETEIWIKIEERNL